MLRRWKCPKDYLDIFWGALGIPEKKNYPPKKKSPVQSSPVQSPVWFSIWPLQSAFFLLCSIFLLAPSPFFTSKNSTFLTGVQRDMLKLACVSFQSTQKMKATVAMTFCSLLCLKATWIKLGQCLLHIKCQKCNCLHQTGFSPNRIIKSLQRWFT